VEERSISTITAGPRELCTCSRGGLLETHGTSRDGRLQQRALHADSSIVFGSDYVHDVINVCPQQAVSLHVYAPRLDAMTYYRVDERSGRLVPDRTQRVDHVPRRGRRQS